MSQPVNSGKRYTPAAKATIRNDKARQVPVKETARKLGRTPDAIEQERERLKK